MRGPETFKNSPKLPEGMTAQQLLDEVSENDRATIAKSQGISLQEFDRFLATKSREERVSGYMRDAKNKLEGVPAERDENELTAERAVIRGLDEVLSSIDDQVLSAEKFEELEREAYILIDQLGAEINNVKAAGIRRRVEGLFKKIATSEALSEVSKHGNSVETIGEIAAALQKKGDRQNIQEYSYALYRAARELQWSLQNSPLAEVRQLVSSYRSGVMSVEQKDLLRRFTQYGKHAYIKQHPKIETDIDRFKYLLEGVANGYKKYGPHRREVSDVSGPSEVYGSYQSDKVSGYRSDSKRRPHRDPSGGNGEPSL